MKHAFSLLFLLAPSCLLLACGPNQVGDADTEVSSNDPLPLGAGPSSPLNNPRSGGAIAIPTTLGNARAATTPRAVSGRIIVKFKSAGPEALTQCAQRWIAEGRSFRDATADRSDSLDRLRRDLGVRGAWSLLPERAGLSTADAVRTRLLRIDRLRLRLQGRAQKVQPAAALPDVLNAYVLEADAGVDVEVMAKRYEADPHVEYAQPDYEIRPVFTPNDPYYSSSGSWGQPYDDLWGIKKIAAAPAWDVSQGAGIVVGLIDTGLDESHPDIAANVWTNSDEIPANGIDDDNNGFVDDVHGWDFGSGDSDPTDFYGHGTHVAGIIAAVGNNGLGVIGVAPRAKIMVAKGFDDAGGGSTSSLARAMIYAADNGAEVLNNSWGCAAACPSNPVVEDAVRHAHGLGVTVVFAAGNSGIDVSGTSPQNMAEVVVVSASDPSDQRPYFSNFGFVDVAAPGGGTTTPPPAATPLYNVLSLKASSCSLCDPSWVVGGTFVRLAGTSMAAPHVAGLAALIRAQHPTYSPEQIRQVLRAGADDVGAPGFDLDTGYGRVNASKSMSEPAPLEALITAPLAANVSDTTPLEIFGTAGGPGFASWRLEFGKGPAPASWTTLASSTTAVANAHLATWNVGQVPDGDYTLRLVATNTLGRSYEDRQGGIVIDRVAITSPTVEKLLNNTRDPITMFSRDTVVPIQGTAAPANFASYRMRLLRRRDNTEVSGAVFTLTNGGLSPVREGTLGTWTAPSASEHYRLLLEVVLTDGTTITKEVGVASDPTLHPGWPRRLMPPPISTEQLDDHLTAADVDNDGRPELLVGLRTVVHVLDASGADRPGWPQSVDPNGIGAIAYSSPAVGDLTGDGVPEIVAANITAHIFVWQADGTLLPGWPKQFGPSGVAGYTYHSVAIDDINGDGKNEIIATAVTSDGTQAVTVLDKNGTPLPGWPQGIKSGPIWTGPPVIGDMDGTGGKEIAVTNLLGPRTVHLFSSTGTIVPGWPKVIDPSQTEGTVFSSHPVLGDLDGSGRLALVVGRLDGQVDALDRAGASVSGWPKNTGTGTAVMTPAIGDIDGDGRPEVVAGTHFFTSNTGIVQDQVFAWHGNGASVAGWPVTEPLPANWFAGFGVAAPALADVDGNGQPDVLFGVGYIGWDPFLPSALHAYGPSGAVLPGFPKLTSEQGGSRSNTPAIADFDGDGLLEMAWTDINANVYMWDLPSAGNAPRPWPMFLRDATHSGANPPLPGQLLFTDNFEDGSASDWTVHSGTWAIATDGSRMFQQSSLTGDARASNGSPSWTDQVVEATIKPVSFNGTDRFVALFARFQDPGNYYYVTLRSSGKLELKKLVAGKAVTLASKAFSVQTNAAYRVKLEIIGTALKAYVNGNLQLAATDSQFASGKVGLGTYYASARFDDIVVTSTAPSKPALATGPVPSNAATNVSTTPVLDWTAGAGATSQDVYFGTSNPPAFQTNQPDTLLHPGDLAPNTTYFWRVDERNAAGTTAGPVWRFTTGSPTLLSDDFESGSLSQWSVQSGTWGIATDGSKVLGQTNTTGNARVSAGSSSWTDQKVQASVKIVSFNGTDRFVAVFARFQDANNYYYVNLRSSGKLELKKLVGGTAVVLASRALAVATNTWYTVRLDVVGSSLNAYVNGVLQASVQDSQFASGNAGLGTYYASARFDNFVVLP